MYCKIIKKINACYACYGHCTRSNLISFCHLYTIQYVMYYTVVYCTYSSSKRQEQVTEEQKRSIVFRQLTNGVILKCCKIIVEGGKKIREKACRGRTGTLFLVSMLLIPLPREAGKNIREKAKTGRTGAMFLVSMLLIPLPREAGKNIREKGRGGRLGLAPRQYVADTTPE